jgi:uncharacterized protein YneF (UPF0154 family)
LTTRTLLFALLWVLNSLFVPAASGFLFAAKWGQKFSGKNPAKTPEVVRVAREAGLKAWIER